MKTIPMLAPLAVLEEGKTLLKNIEAKKQSLPLAWQRLAQMESWLQGA
ncbi:MAG: hypothetical protein IV108_11735 [Burkholderiales bacterium]|nr:hypothetical protein [Burkholderiales bacterium]